MREDWEYKKLGEVCDFQGGSQPPKSEWSKELKPNYIRMLQIRDFTQSATNYIEYVKLSKSLKCCEKDDILLARYGASVGKILSGLSGAYNVAIMKSMPNPDYITSPYIKYYFLSPVFQYRLSIVSQHRAAQAGFSKEDISDFQLPIPSLIQQQSIVAELDKINEIIDLKKAQLKDLDLLAQSIFYDMFGDPIENSKGWEVKKLGEVCTDVKYGTSKPACEGGKYKYLRMNNLTADGHLDLSNLKYIDIPDSEIEKCIVRKGDVLFNRTNSIDLVGKTCEFTLEEPMVIAGYIIRIRLSDEIIPTFVSICFNTKAYKKLLRTIAKGAVNQANINSKELQAIEIPLPPLSLQQSFSSKIQSIESQKSAIKQSLAEVETLLASRMDYWFG